MPITDYSLMKRYKTFLKDVLDGITYGVATASKVVILDANKALDVVRTAQLRIGVSGSEVIQSALPDAKYVTAALQNTAIPAASMAGAKTVHFENTGVTPATLTTDTAAAIAAAIPGAQVGQTYTLNIRNSSASANTATVAGGTGVTPHGTLTIAQNTTRQFAVVLTSLTAVDIYSMGISAAAV